MEIKDFVQKYWNKAVEADKNLNIPAIYILAHAAIETKLGEQKTLNYIHGEEIVILNDIKEDLREFKQLWINLWLKIKSFFKSKEIKVKQDIKQDIDYVEDFLTNSKYNFKLQFVQNIDILGESLYSNKQELIDMVDKIKSTLQELKYI